MKKIKEKNSETLKISHNNLALYKLLVKKITLKILWINYILGILLLLLLVHKKKKILLFFKESNKVLKRNFISKSFKDCFYLSFKIFFIGFA